MTSQLATTPAPVTTPGEHGERKHARCSPSKLKALALCPSYESDNSAPPHPVTLRGTAMHEAMETLDDTKLLDDVELKLVAMCREFIADDLAQAVEVIQEIHVKTHDPDVQGFLDLMLVMPVKPNGMKKALIRDWKFGFNPVPSPEVNPQAISYVVGVFLARPDIDEIEFAFAIPRLDLILSHTFTRDMLPDLQLGISAIANRVRTEADLTFTPHIDNCQYCAKVGQCPATWERALRIGAGYKNEEETLPIPTSYDPRQVMDPVQMGRMLNLAYHLERWVKEAKAAAHAMRLEMGTEVPGYDWIEKRGARTIQNPVRTFALAQEYGVTQEEYLAAAKVSLPQVIEAVRAHTPAGVKKKDREQAFEDALTNEDLISRGDSFHVLQRSRKRVAVSDAQLPAGDATSGS